MRKIYVISDTHFNHNNIIKYCNRPFKDVQEMNETLISNWNNTVDNTDIVYMLGDFCLGPADCIAPLVQRLNGHKILITGNHDRQNKKIYLDAGFEKVIKETAGIIYLDGNREVYINFSHHPHPEMLHNIYEHVHDLTDNNDAEHFCACVEQISYTPIELQEIINRMGW